MATQYGPFPRVTVVYHPTGTRKKYRSQQVYKSLPRGSMILPYSVISHEANGTGGLVSAPNVREPDAPNMPMAYKIQGGDSSFGYLRAQAYQKAYGKFVEKVRASASWGPNIAERKQAFEMMLGRVGQLTRAARSLRRGDIAGMAGHLGVRKRKLKKVPKELSDTWLEYHFGWEPLVKDIYETVEILGGKFPVNQITAAASSEWFDRGTQWNNYPWERTYSEQYMRVGTRLSGTYTVNNPNLFLANQLGVINPVSVAWELVPFSFVVDWFIPVGQFFGSYTDFFGLTRQREFVTTRADSKGRYVTTYHNGYESRAPLILNEVNFRMYRQLGLTTPIPVPKVFKGFSTTRGATAIALLVGVLNSLKK